MYGHGYRPDLTRSARCRIPEPTDNIHMNMGTQEERTMHLFTLGYLAGWHDETLARWLEETNTILADIRLTPYSRHAAWRESALRARLGQRYVHLPALGNIHHTRRDQPIVLADADTGVAQLIALLRQHHSVALLCACVDVGTCHRAMVAALVAQHLPHVPITHLAPSDVLAGFQPADQLTLFDMPLPGEYAVPESPRIESCRSCNAPIVWTQSPHGHALPLSIRRARLVHGQWYAPSHFSDCPDATQWSSRRKRHAST